MFQPRSFCLAFLILVGPAVGCSGPTSNPTDGDDAGTVSECSVGSPTYENFVEELMEENCLECHSASVEGVDRQAAPPASNFDTEEDIGRQIEVVRQRVVVEGTMPIGEPLTDCEREKLDAYLDDLAEQPCVPSCDDRSCGDDGCGGSCGTCEEPESCDAAGQCVDDCSPDCAGRVCGDDGCGGSCGDCPGSLACSTEGECSCEPDCTDRVCGDDGCGGSCGSCAGSLVCNTTLGQCVDDCTPDCTDRVCGDDGCDGSCGTCASSEACDSTGQCVCVPDCSGAECGGDGCGGSCGTCASGQSCDSSGTCVGSPSWSQDVYPIFDASGCASGGSCHGGAMPSEGLDLSSESVAYSGLVDVASVQCTSRKLVKPGDSSTMGSYLVAKLVGTDLCSGTKMPKMGSLPTSDVDAVKLWIDDGAQNN